MKRFAAIVFAASLMGATGSLALARSASAVPSSSCRAAVDRYARHQDSSKLERRSLIACRTVAAWSAVVRHSYQGGRATDLAIGAGADDIVRALRFICLDNTDVPLCRHVPAAATTTTTTAPSVSVSTTRPGSTSPADFAVWCSHVRDIYDRIRAGEVPTGDQAVALLTEEGALGNNPAATSLVQQIQGESADQQAGGAFVLVLGMDDTCTKLGL